MRFQANTIIGALLVTFVVVMFVTSIYLPPAPYGTMGPALFPRVLLIALFPMCAALFIRGLWEDLREKRSGEFDLSAWFYEYRNVIVTYALFFSFALFLPYAGYLLSGFAFLFLMQVALGPKTWDKVPQYLAITIGVLAALYLLFRWFLLVLLPEGEIF